MQLRTVTKKSSGQFDGVGLNTATRGAFDKVTRLEETATAKNQYDEKRRTYRYLVAGGVLDGDHGRAGECVGASLGGGTWLNAGK